MTSLSDRQQTWFQWLHRHPELGGEERETAAFVRRTLEEAGIRLLDCPVPTGVVAEIGRGSGPVIGLRADMDALPVQEESGLPYASEAPGRMHACGHDFHTAALLGAALLLREAEERLPGRALLVFQPAEELSRGAKQMVATGLTDPADVFLSLHTYPYAPAGTVGVREGAVMAAVDRFKVTVTGKGTHAGHPHRGIDPIPPLAELTLALQTIVSRRNSPFTNALLSVTHLAAGNTWNVIPESVYLEGTIRTLDEEVRADMRERLRRISEGVCLAHDCRAEVWWEEGPPAVVNDPELCALAREVAREEGLEVIRQEESMGGEDFAEYLRHPRRRPGLFVRIGTGGGYPNHHPRFTADPAALQPASVLLRDMTLRLMGGAALPSGR